jgi:hypothetical protein
MLLRAVNIFPNLHFTDILVAIKHFIYLSLIDLHSFVASQLRPSQFKWDQHFSEFYNLPVLLWSCYRHRFVSPHISWNLPFSVTLNVLTSRLCLYSSEANFHIHVEMLDQTLFDRLLFSPSLILQVNFIITPGYNTEKWKIVSVLCATSLVRLTAAVIGLSKKRTSVFSSSRN